MGYSVKSVERALSIVERLGKEQSGSSLTALSDDLGIPVSSCYSLLETLVARGYVLRDPRDKTYSLSSKWADIVPSGAENLRLRAQADPVMEAIYELCGESVTLAIWDGDEMLVIHNKISRGPVVIVNRIGARLPVHATAMGKATLACWPRQSVDDWLASRDLEPLTANTVVSPDEFRAAVDEVRAGGLAYAYEELAEGVCAAGACILDSRERPAGALSVVMPARRTRNGRYVRCLGELTRTGARIIGARMGSTASQGQLGLEALNDIWEGYEAGADW